MVELACLAKAKVSEMQCSSYKKRLEVMLISWLYDLIRTNVKRGRVFDLRQVLLQSSADCLGYAKLFTLLGRLFGLDAGIIEVVVDNAGRYVPHTACLVKLCNGRQRFVDLWYGSTNIKHNRLGLRVRRGGIWNVEDLELSELDSIEVCYLPDPYANAITLYIRGNQHLERQGFAAAIECYSQALRLYPNNARFYYNRAVAYESLGEFEKAKADYAQALADDEAIIRVLATEHDEIVSLINLDAKGIGNLAQEMYLLHKGFATGKQGTLPEVARRFGFSETGARDILSAVEAKLTIGKEQFLDLDDQTTATYNK